MKLYKNLCLLASAAVMLAFASACSDDKDLIPLDKTDMSLENATYSTLTFEWPKVAGARQYSYQFRRSDSEDILDMGLTKDTRLTFTGLEPATDYTLTVLAYAAIGSGNTTSEPIVLTARTSDLITIPTPVPQWTREVNTIIVTWESVEGARDYAYTLTDAEGNTVSSATTYSTSVQFPAMTTGVYTFSVVAQTQLDGHRDSAPGDLTIDFTREREEIWRISGIYASVLTDSSWDATLVAYDDNSYTLLSWYGTAGYNLDFVIDENNAADMFSLNDDSYTYNSATGSYAVPTGQLSPATVNVYPAANRCAMAGNPGKGTITLEVSDGNKSGNDTFKWGVSIDDFLGTWNLDFAGYDYYDSSYDETYTATVEITLGSEANTLIVPMPNYYGYVCGSATMTVDLDSMTFTVQPVSFGGVWTFAGADSATTPLTGKLSDTKIEFSAIQAWYSGYDYLAENSYLIYTR